MRDPLPLVALDVPPSLAPALRRLRRRLPATPWATELLAELTAQHRALAALAATREHQVLHAVPPPVLAAGGLTLDPSRWRVEYQGRRVTDLRKAEMVALTALVASVGQPVPFARLTATPTSTYAAANRIKSVIARLRQRVGVPIRAIVGFGYVLELEAS